MSVALSRTGRASRDAALNGFARVGDSEAEIGVGDAVVVDISVDDAVADVAVVEAAMVEVSVMDVSLPVCQGPCNRPAAREMPRRNRRAYIMLARKVERVSQNR